MDSAVINDAETLDVDYVDAGNDNAVKIEEKEVLNDADLVDVVAEIKAGNITLEGIQSQYQLTEEQIKTIQDATV